MIGIKNVRNRARNFRVANSLGGMGVTPVHLRLYAEGVKVSNRKGGDLKKSTRNSWEIVPVVSPTKVVSYRSYVIQASGFGDCRLDDIRKTPGLLLRIPGSASKNKTAWNERHFIEALVLTVSPIRVGEPLVLSECLDDLGSFETLEIIIFYIPASLVSFAIRPCVGDPST